LILPIHDTQTEIEISQGETKTVQIVVSNPNVAVKETLMSCYNTHCSGVVYTAIDGTLGDTTMSISGLTMTVVASHKMSSL
jgi:hypothetical protein